MKFNGVRPYKLQFRFSLEKFNGVRPHKRMGREREETMSGKWKRRYGLIGVVVLCLMLAACGGSAETTRRSLRFS